MRQIQNRQIKREGGQGRYTDSHGGGQKIRESKKDKIPPKKDRKTVEKAQTKEFKCREGYEKEQICGLVENKVKKKKNP